MVPTAFLAYLSWWANLLDREGVRDNFASPHMMVGLVKDAVGGPTALTYSTLNFTKLENDRFMCCQRSTNNPMEVRTWDKPYMTCGSWTGSKKTIKHALLLCNGQLLSFWLWLEFPKHGQNT